MQIKLKSEYMIPIHTRTLAQQSVSNESQGFKSKYSALKWYELSINTTKYRLLLKVLLNQTRYMIKPNNVTITAVL